jgi:hypothetical protein
MPDTKRDEIIKARQLLEENGFTVISPASKALNELARKAVDGDAEDRRRYLEAIVSPDPIWRDEP